MYKFIILIIAFIWYMVGIVTPDYHTTKHIQPIKSQYELIWGSDNV